MKQTMATIAKCITFLSLLIIVQPGVTAQSYFAGSGAGAGNTSVNSAGFGTGALGSGNSGSGTAAFGFYALHKNTTGLHNVAFGTYSLNNNSSGTDNSSLGYFSMQYNTTGGGNTALGAYALTTNTSGYNNVALGKYSIYSNTTGNSNLGMGNNSLYKNLTGSSNLAFGYNALYSNTSGNYNIAMGGYNTLYSNTGGNYNIALGLGSLSSNTTAGNNIALGVYTLNANTTGYNNIAVGQNSLYNNVTGYNNTAIGYNALFANTGANNIAIGQFAGTAFAGNNRCTFLGNYSDASVSGLSNATAIGYLAQVTASNKVVVGNTSVTSIGGQVGWTTLSDLRLKQNINKSKLGLNFILSLNPVSYNYKADGQKDIVYTGLIAQELDAAATKAGIAFSAVDKNGEYWGIRYAELTVPLIKAMQEMNEKYDATIEELKKQIEELRTEKGTIKNNPSNMSKSTVQSILFQNQPNPFNQSTVIRYELKKDDEKACIVIRNINGALIKQVNISQSDKGQVRINANELSAGTYTYTLIVNNVSVETKLMVLVK